MNQEELHDMIVHGFHIGCAVQNSREDMKAYCLIVEFVGQTFSAAQKIQRRKCPLIAGTNLRPGITLALVRSPHGQQVPDGHIVDGFLAPLDLIVGEKAKNLIVNASDLSLVQCNSNQQRNNALCGRHNMGAVICFVVIPAVRIYFLAVSIGDDLTDVWLLLCYANCYLFEPLGIATHENYYAETAEEHKQFTIGKTPKTNIWFCDPDGLGTPGYGLCMSAEDMAKIGLLCLNKGIYGGKQIVSASWIEEMTMPRTVESDHFRGMDYGYLWWIIDREKKIYAAIGNSGNVIYINPEKDIVVAVASYFKPTVFDRVDFIREYVEPLITER